MSIPTTDSQGTKVYIADLGTAVSDATEIDAAITGGKQIGCLQDIGDIGTTRAVTEYGCISSDEVTKSLGSLSLPAIDMSLLFDAADAAGQAELRTMSSTKTRRVFIVVLNDDPEGTTHNPTYITFDGGISGEKTPVAKDAAVMYNVTVEIMSVPNTTLAAFT